MKSLFTTVGIIAMALFLTVSARAAEPASAEAPFYEVKITSKIEGNKKISTIRGTGISGYHCNMQFPWKITLVAGKDLPEKKVYQKADAKVFTEKEVVFEVVTGKEGADIEIKMSYCDDKGCKMEKKPYKL